MVDRSRTLTVYNQGVAGRRCGTESAEEVRPELVCVCVHVRQGVGKAKMWARFDCTRCGGIGRGPGAPMDYSAGSVSPHHLAALERATRLLEEVDRG